MKSETMIRKHIALAQHRLAQRELGLRERAAAEAVVVSLRWVVNKTAASSPEGAVIDAMIEDAHFDGNGEPTPYGEQCGFPWEDGPKTL